jgi:hypothetical protein
LKTKKKVKVVYPPMLKPDRKHGYSEGLIKKIMTKREYKEFCKWMNGQTCALDEITGEIVTYPYDVLRFLEMKRNGGPDFWD